MERMLPLKLDAITLLSTLATSLHLYMKPRQYIGKAKINRNTATVNKEKTPLENPCITRQPAAVLPEIFFILPDGEVDQTEMGEVMRYQ